MEIVKLQKWLFQSSGRISLPALITYLWHALRLSMLLKIFMRISTNLCTATLILFWFTVSGERKKVQL